MDTKRYARFHRPGHAVTGDRRKGGALSSQGRGYEYAHAIVDDHTRLAYVELHPDERAPTPSPTSPDVPSRGSIHGLHNNPLRENNALLRWRPRFTGARAASDSAQSHHHTGGQSMRSIGGALEANLARTAVEVVVPPGHATLLEITAPWRGVHGATEQLLREVHHHYVGWAETLTDLHRRAMNDFHYLNGHDRGAEAIAIVCDLYVKILREATPRRVREDAARHWLIYLEHVTRQSGKALSRNAPVLHSALVELEDILCDAPGLAPTASPGLRKLAAALTDAPTGSADGATEAALALLRASLEIVYEHWLARDDPAAWRREIAPPGPQVGPDGDKSELVTHADLRRMRERLRQLDDIFMLRDHAQEIVAFPDNTRIIRGYLAEADALGRGGGSTGAVAKIDWLLKVLEHPDLVSARETALRAVARTCSDVLARGAGADRIHLVRTVFELLHRHSFPYPTTVLNLITGLGRESLASREPDLADALVDEVLATDFEYPGFHGFTAEWNVRVNPSHLEAIRTYLRTIEADPVAACPLLAALVAHLRLGGVSIVDSALFQRDVSSLLARDIQPVYVQVKHLLKLLPVYFSEIGAEGELRKVSTRIDEAVHRGDPLCNFLRKQSHVECNPHLIDFVEEIARFWVTGDRGPLAAYVPESLFGALDVNDPTSRGVHAAFGELARQTGSVDGIFALDLADLRAHLASIPDTDDVDRERGELLVRIWREIRRKYTLDHTDVMQRLRAFHRIDSALLTDLEAALAESAHAEALDHALTVLERLQAIVLRRGETQAYEDIYYKRHIAVGIPSMYGSYREERLDAMGLTFRMESLTSTLMARVMLEEALPSDPVGRLRMIAGWLTQLHRGLRIDGFRAQGIAHALAMLNEALTRPATTNEQLLNVFQLLSRNLESTIRARILEVYEEPLRRVIRRMIERNVLLGDRGDEGVLRHSEALIRDLIAESLALQRFDGIVGQSISELRDSAPRLTRPASPPLDLDRSLVPLATAPAELGPVALGKKAFMLRRLAQIGMRVPEGFVLTTDVFLARDVLRASPQMRRRLEDRVREELTNLERRVGARFGDAERPLLLSVRSGAPLSMPGMLATYLNVGMSPAVTEGVAATQGAWAAWDAYRRFVQSWGMGHGLDRDRFDRLIADAKRRSGVPRKALLSPDDMGRLAHSYQKIVADADIVVEEDPFAQLLACIDLVQASWDAPGARLYRQELQLADEWGTAVIVQAMVFGNLGPRSGSGVLLTTDPRRACDSLELSGDFTVQSQGDDVVGGLVTTFPITERQRQREARDVDISLEKDFPAIHQALGDVAHSLIKTHGMNHQEIEFTFESDRAEDLYLLQTRDTVVGPRAVVSAFSPSDALDGARVAAGIGVSGGALSGRVAHTAEDIAALRARDPSGAVILLRPDTVPDDIALVLACDGLLTALGGATSHAAVAAKRLGKTCVVGCRLLDVDERHGMSRIGPHALRTGDLVSISGLDGTVYLGAHPVEMVGVRGRAQQ